MRSEVLIIHERIGINWKFTFKFVTVVPEPEK